MPTTSFLNCNLPLTTTTTLHRTKVIIQPRSTLSLSLSLGNPLSPTNTNTNTFKPSFEAQELTAQLTTILTQKIDFTGLAPAKTAELVSYCQALTSDSSPSPLGLDLSSMSEEQLSTLLISGNSGSISSPSPPSTKPITTSFNDDTDAANIANAPCWNLIFSTETKSLISALPPLTRVKLKFLTPTTLDYSIIFTENWMKNIRTSGTYTLGRSKVSDDVILEFIYSKAGVKLFSFDLPLPMLKGTKNYVLFSYFDGKLLVEKGWTGGVRGLEEDAFYNCYIFD